MRTSEISRKTNETDISIRLNLDGTGKSKISTKCGFLDHMLTLFSSHGRFDLEISCDGDTYIDFHHTTEDVGIALGQAFSSALKDKRGINRYGDIHLPMDEALVLCALDLSGRDFVCTDLKIPTQKVGDFDTELVSEFLLGFARNCGLNLHMRTITGDNSHHIIEACFKALGRCLKHAVAIDPAFANEIPSTKGVL